MFLAFTYLLIFLIVICGADAALLVPPLFFFD